MLRSPSSRFSLIQILAIHVVFFHHNLEKWQCSGFTAARTSFVSGRKHHDNMQFKALSMVSVSSNSNNKIGLASDSFLREYFNSDISDVNLPPSLNIVRRSLAQLASGSDIRGRYVATPSTAKGARSFAALAQAIGQSNLPALTPFAAHCLGYAFATMLKDEQLQDSNKEDLVICMGRDPRIHGSVLADAFSRGAGGVPGVKVVYTGLATTPALFEFCRTKLCQGGVMVTASHLPSDRNGFKFFTQQKGGFTKSEIQNLILKAQEHAQVWFDMGILPPTSGSNGVFCSELVHWMPFYEQQLKRALCQQLGSDDYDSLPLKGLKIVLNAGNGSGGFFRQVLDDLGASSDGSIHTTPNSEFPNGIPNPEYDTMIKETIQACEAAHADLGILLDTDADRCGMVAPRSYLQRKDQFIPTHYEPLNRNRLIAMMGVIYARQAPGCAVVTDSVTSTGLSLFLESNLGLKHVRYLRGYANVIQRAQQLNREGLVNAQVAIETSGHCAVQENGFLDDGTYTAVKILGLLAQERQKQANPQRQSILNLISSLQELEEVIEFRLHARDGSLESMDGLFDFVALEIESICELHETWTMDNDNLEGIRVSTGTDGSYFLLRKSLHDPVFCLQVEANSKKNARQNVVEPLLRMFQSQQRIVNTLDLSALENY
ncbi:phosphoglucomutase/phosphomannomutase domain containing protein [Nitzschia inconspicua]|uniref:Phosphoglucomutase/phosphomannomutase domain containing protein n=1 Tax=Nitzschia inconspicua TaxID=303405 RepID=A0A9K3KB02_9STRA|nr:phosphoglucomutase/phosphomannomutase domain containing protein [Nitzschia inconspicua]KAG7340427.1 phosphoglucomutase/phosphomannomutase domain containing protein [Nitzschia inconspicua]